MAGFADYKIDELANTRARLTVYRERLNQLRVECANQEREVEQLERHLVMTLSPFRVGDRVITAYGKTLVVEYVELQIFESTAKYDPTTLLYCLVDDKGDVIHSGLPLEFIKKYED